MHPASEPVCLRRVWVLDMPGYPIPEWVRGPEGPPTTEKTRMYSIMYYPSISRKEFNPMCPKRLKNDINDVLQSQEILQSIGVTASLAPDDKPSGLRHLVVTIEGPQDTVYEGVVYVLDVLLSQGYPFHPPNMTFATDIWHPDVCRETGKVNLVRALFVVYQILSQAELDPHRVCSLWPIDSNSPGQRSGPL